MKSKIIIMQRTIDDSWLALIASGLTGGLAGPAINKIFQNRAIRKARELDALVALTESVIPYLFPLRADIPKRWRLYNPVTEQYIQ